MTAQGDNAPDTSEFDSKPQPKSGQPDDRFTFPVRPSLRSFHEEWGRYIAKDASSTGLDEWYLSNALASLPG